MPRNSSGTYSLPAGNPVVTATTISSTWANTTLSDIATALTDSLSRSGDGGMTAPLELDDGAVGAPGLTWVSEPTSGLYRAGAGDHRYSISATDVVQITANGLRAANGAAATPSFSFISDTNTGFYHNASTDSFSAVTGGVERVKFWTGSLPLRLHSTDTSGDVALGFYESDGTTQKGYIGYAGSSDDVFSIWNNENANVVLATNNTTRLTISTSAVTSTLPVMAPDGSAGSPAVTFSGDTDTGLYRVGANAIGFAAAGSSVVNFSSSTASFIPPVQVQNGSASAPTYSFNSDADTGIYRHGADTMGFTAGGTSRFYIASSYIQTDVTQYITDGNTANPAIRFSSDADTGFYRDTDNQIGIALGGTTAGQIAQGSFTATLTGFTANPTGTVTYKVIGNHVTLYCSAGISATSNANTMTMTGLPAIVRPAATTLCYGGQTVNNGSITSAEASISAAGTITFAVNRTDLVTNFVSSSSVSWTNSGNKGIQAGWSITYPLS